MRCAALCLAALLAAPTLAQDYSGLCMTPANYQGGRLTRRYDYGPLDLAKRSRVTSAMADFTSSGNDLAGDLNFQRRPTLPCSSKRATSSETVNIVASYCCGTGDAASRRSGCWADYSYRLRDARKLPGGRNVRSRD